MINRVSNLKETGNFVIFILFSILDIKSQSSVQDKQKYESIKELLKGDYFGEISILGNLSVTCTIHSVSKSVVWKLHKEPFLRFVDEFEDSKYKIFQKINKYDDEQFKKFHSFFENIRWLKRIGKPAIRAIVLKLKRNLHHQGNDILKFKQISH